MPPPRYSYAILITINSYHNSCTFYLLLLYNGINRTACTGRVLVAILVVCSYLPQDILRHSLRSLKNVKRLKAKINTCCIHFEHTLHTYLSTQFNFAKKPQISCRFCVPFSTNFCQNEIEWKGILH